MEQKTGYKLEHCRPNCIKAIQSWEPLKLRLSKALEVLNLRQGLNEKFATLLYHHIPKICIAACPNGCSQPQIKDFAIMGYLIPIKTSEPCLGCLVCVNTCLENAAIWTDKGIRIDSELCISCGACVQSCPTGTLTSKESGWELRLGGRVGRHPRFAVKVGQVVTDGEVVEWVIKTLHLYIEQGNVEERLSNFLERKVLINAQNDRESIYVSD